MSHRMTIRLDDELRDRLVNYRKATGVAFQTAIERFVDDGLLKWEERSPETRWRKPQTQEIGLGA